MEKHDSGLNIIRKLAITNRRETYTIKPGPYCTLMFGINWIFFQKKKKTIIELNNAPILKSAPPPRFSAYYHRSRQSSIR